MGFPAIHRSALATRRRALAASGGFTLVELLISMTILLIVLAAALSVISVTSRAQPVVTDKVADIQAGRVAIDGMVRELRQAIAVETATASTLSARTYVRHTTCGGPPAAATAAPIVCLVTYSCASGACTRTEESPSAPGTGTPVRLIDGLRSSAPFTYSPDAVTPTYVTIALELAARDGSESVTVDGGATLRNATGSV